MGCWVGGLVGCGWVEVGVMGWWVEGWVVCVWVCVCVSVDFELCLWLILLCGKHSQVESVADLPNDSAGVLKVTRMRTKISCGPKGEKLA